MPTGQGPVPLPHGAGGTDPLAAFRGTLPAPTLEGRSAPHPEGSRSSKSLWSCCGPPESSPAHRQPEQARLALARESPRGWGRGPNTTLLCWAPTCPWTPLLQQQPPQEASVPEVGWHGVAPTHEGPLQVAHRPDSQLRTCDTVAIPPLGRKHWRGESGLAEREDREAVATTASGRQIKRLMLEAQHPRLVRRGLREGGHAPFWISVPTHPTFQALATLRTWWGQVATEEDAPTGRLVQLLT